MRRFKRSVVALGAAVMVAVGLGVTPAAAAGTEIIGSLDSVVIAPDGSIRVTGWAVVRGWAPVMVHVYDTGPTRTVGTDLGVTGVRRPDVEAALGGTVTGFNTLTGFDGSVIPAESGVHRICAYGVAGSSVALLGCRGLTTGFAPVGAIDAIPETASQGQPLRVRGWAYDPDRPGRSIGVHAYVLRNGRVVAGTQLSAVSDRPDIAAAIPGAGRAHGLDQDVSLQLPDVVPNRPDLDGLSGTLSVCLFAIGLGEGGNTLLGCRNVDVRPAVTASLDDVSVTAVGEITVRGWSFLTQRPSETTSNALVLTPLDNPDAAQPPGVTFPADQLRPDVDTAFAGVGTHHGFAGVTIAVPPGRYSACVWSGGAPGPFVADGVVPARICRDVAVPNAVGAIDSVTVSGSPGAYSVTVRGWSVDPVRPGSATDVRVVLGSPGDANSFADVVGRTEIDRPDVNAALGVQGRHGFAIVVPSTSAFQIPVCAMAGVFPAADCTTAFATATATLR